METQSVTMPRLMTIREVARTGVIREHTLRQLIKQGAIPHVQVGNRQLVNYVLLVKLLNEM